VIEIEIVDHILLIERQVCLAMTLKRILPNVQIFQITKSVEFTEVKVRSNGAKVMFMRVHADSYCRSGLELQKHSK